MRILKLFGFVAILLCAVDAGAVRAQTKSAPSGTIAVVGDSLADGMWGGIYRFAQKDGRFKVFRGAKNSVGFTSGDLTDMVDRAFAANPDVQAVVMMIGANDRRTIFVDGKPTAIFRTPGWLELYRIRVEKFMDHVAAKGVPLVWILLPVMRDIEATIDADLVNGIVTEAAGQRSHVHLVETAKLTADETGAYTAHFNDLTGQKRLMRTSDGVHFEAPAYELFADRVFKALKVASPRFAQLPGP